MMILIIHFLMKTKFFLVAAFFLFAIFPAKTFAFSDLNSSDWFYDATSSLVSEDIVKGYSNNTVRPANKVNRAELAVLLYRVLDVKNLPTSGVRWLAFNDVKEGDWYFDAFSVLAGEHVFDTMQVYPSRNLNRAELAIIIARFLEAVGIELSSKTGNFSDVAANAWYSDAVKQLNAIGIMKGYSNYTFGPANEVNRAELFVVINRMLDLVEDHMSEKYSGLEEARELASNSKNCDDIDCLIEAAQECEPADLTSTYELDLFYPFTLEVHLKVDERDGLCEYYIRYEDAEAFMGGVIETEETLEQANKDLQYMVGMDGVCWSEDEDEIAEILENNWKKLNFSSDDHENLDCLGPVFETAIRI